MVIEEYKREFAALYEKMQNEHGKVGRVIIEDNTELKRNQMPTNADFRLIDVSIIF